MSLPWPSPTNQTPAFVLLTATLIVAATSGLGLFAAALGVGKSSGWRQGWGLWLPSVFGASIAVWGLSYALMLARGIR
jgi:hypothetical protein